MYQFIDIKIQHASLIHQWKTDPYMIQMALDESSPSTLESQQQDIQRSLQNTGSLYHLIVLEDQPIGYIRIDWMDNEHTYAWLRFAMGTNRKQGHMTKALSQYITTLYKNGCHRIEAEVYDYNTPSSKLLKKLGFQLEGQKRKAHYYQGHYCDIFVFGLLKEDMK